MENLMRDDDAPVGRLLTRREAVALLGIAMPAASVRRALAQESAARTPAAVMPCVVQPEQTEGPYFVDRMLKRSDIRTDPATGVTKAGVPLWLTFNVGRVASGGGCVPLAGAHIDVWQCDAAGIYSGVKDPNFNTVGQHFLRGYQITDANGSATFTTIYPGWYPGRTVHVHFKVRTEPSAQRGQEFTSQLYFDEGVSDRVLSREPYAAGSSRRTRNEADGIFRRAGGAQLILALREHQGGYKGEFSLAIKSA
jgi:protocatechuate 3,4-dioxygenase beta subunit